MLLRNYSVIFDFPHRLQVELKIKGKIKKIYISAQKELEGYDKDILSFQIRFNFLIEDERYHTIGKREIDIENSFEISPKTFDEQYGRYYIHYDRYYMKVKTLIRIW
jgi:hypothetical protein